MSDDESDPTHLMCVRDYIHRNAEQSPDQTYLIDPAAGRSLTFAECQSEVQRISSLIDAQGIKAGETVAFAFSNSVDSALTILGLLYGGYVATAINLVAGESTIEYVLQHSEAQLVIGDQKGRDLVAPALQSGASSAKIIDRTELMNTHPRRTVEPNPVDTDTEGLLMYTSGTTGRPKGVVLTQMSLLAGGKNAVNAHELSSADCGLCVLPFYHINAFCVSLMGSLVSRSSLVVPERFSVSSFWEIVRDQKCSWFSVVPTQISYLLHDAETDKNVSSQCNLLRFGRSASAPLSPDMHAAFEKRFGIPLIETMGLTETAAPILSNPMPPGIRKIGSPGIAYGNEVMIGSKRQNEVERGEEGEILVRGDNVLKHYRNNVEATNEAITKDDWFRTGDLGRMDEDGYVFVTGRLKELIIKGGENIAPREVDEALYCHPDVIEAAAFAVHCPNYGQRVEAGVKLTVGSTTSRQDLLNLCREKLGAFKSPDAIYILMDLPKGPSGKIQRIKLAEIISQQS
ncbi:MAG: AMP-binding protein [Hyphomicrobiales bacterium]